MYHYHSGAFLSIIGEGPRLILDFECYQGSSDSNNKDEGELTIAKRLLSRVAKNHKKLLDVVVYDALACNSMWINHCIQFDVIPVVGVKNNNIKSIKEVKKRIGKKGTYKTWEDQKRKCEVKAFE